jgi:hypothetical protein
MGKPVIKAIQRDSLSLGTVTINGETYVVITDKEDELSEEGYLIRINDRKATHELSDICDIDLEIVDGQLVIAH